jgi:hypothetical protein
MSKMQNFQSCTQTQFSWQNVALAVLPQPDEGLFVSQGRCLTCPLPRLVFIVPVMCAGGACCAASAGTNCGM